VPRKTLFRTSEYPYHLYARSNNKEWFDLDMSTCWDIFLRHLAKTREKYFIQIHAFTLMNNHFHWLASTPEENLDEAMRYFMTLTSSEIAKMTGRINHVYGGRYKWSLITNPVHYANVYRYVYQNPLRAGICKSIVDYKFCSYTDNRLKVDPIEGFSEHLPISKLESDIWIDSLISEEGIKLIRQAVKKTTFKYSRDPKSKLPITGKEYL
jgi:putative transposase